MKIDGWYRLRIKRNEFLAATDKFMLSDFPLLTAERNKYRDYRQYLRNLPKMYNEETIKDAKVKSYEEFVEWKRGGDY